ncbi:hypothetical protein [Galbibacter pacificus]|uniref:Uncharacterized protein n=1 Tax=Galbibacter pacificus TaxID=2996052 RepID=A0ABT6FRR3_9FLAO|nr:hypothetical protein [Galbibacter pacificus]MDG3582922.1 hypothetical protein [Galbibacter pacificus]MDG3585959.1 hypothetical protein [Galbibacter pacificus]
MRKQEYIAILIFFLSITATYSQGKYFEIVAEKNTHPYDDRGYIYYGRIKPLDDQPYATLHFKDISKGTLHKAIMDYLKKRPTLILKPKFTNEHLIIYRDFATIGNKEQCFAGLTGLVYMYIIPEEDGTVKLDVSTSEIFASLNDAVLRITMDDNVASDSDAPFNKYKYVQPADKIYLSSGSTASKIFLGSRAKRKKHSLKQAYPDSIFDPEGNVVNPVNKALIEDFFNKYAEDLNTYLSHRFK